MTPGHAETATTTTAGAGPPRRRITRGDLARHRARALLGLVAAVAVMTTALVAGGRVLPASALPGDISTVAGTGTFGYSGDGGPATGAQLNTPFGVAVDGGGNLYIADTSNHRVRKVNLLGTITTVAGNGTAGYSGDGGPATAAQLNSPSGMAVDGDGNLYIADALDYRVRKVSPAGTITTVAGTGTKGYSGDGGPATGAQLKGPTGVAVDGAGYLYIADYLDHRVRRVDPVGEISTVAGTGTGGYSGDGAPATGAQLNSPFGVAVDGGASLYIADMSNHRVRKVTPAGTITTVAGTGTPGYSGDGGPATGAELNSPSGVAVDGGGNLSIADRLNYRVRKVSPAGTITTVAGTGTPGYSGDGGPATGAQLNSPFGVALDGVGNLYIGDRDNHRARKVEAVASIPGTILPTTTSIPFPPVTLPEAGTAYPSGDCAGTPVFDGFASAGYVKVRTGSSGGESWVCVAVDDGTRHFGGKVKVAGGTPNPPVDDDDEACDANPASRIVNGDGFVGTVAHDIDVNVAPNGTDAAWVCVEIRETQTGTTLVAKRLVIATATPSGTGFDQDATTPPVPYYVEAPNPGAVSSYCQTAAGTRTRLLNAQVGSAHVWLYTLAQNGGTTQHVCARGQHGGTAGGEHLTVDGGGSQTFVTPETSSDFTVCPIPVAGLSGVYELRAGAGTPAYLCAMVLGNHRRLKVDGGGSQTIVTHAEETS